MSTTDTLALLVSSPWLDRRGNPLSIRPLPGLRCEALRELKFSSAGLMSPAYREFLGVCSGLAGTTLGHIDFTGCWYPVEECAVFYPCLTVAVDQAGRRWITEITEQGLPGRVWCLFKDPAVAVYVSEELATFIATLRKRTCEGQLFSWLQALEVQAGAIWMHRRDFAIRPFQAAQADPQLSAWLKALPSDAYVYDLREPTAARGWPYGLAGPAARLFRYGCLPVFAVAGPYSDGSQMQIPETVRLPSVGPQVSGTMIFFAARRTRWAVSKRRTAQTGELQRCA
jgi:hypothetical protein